MIWFTSDWHLYHTNIIKFCNRPFESVEKMNDTIYHNCAERVKGGDILYFLGDLSFKKKAVDEFVRFIKSLKLSKFYYIVGNHDSHIEHGLSVYFKLEQYKDIAIENQTITLCHYPMYTHEKSHFNAWQLYGHHHKNVSDVVEGKKMNVCVDLTDFYPVSWDEVRAYMTKRPDNPDYIAQTKHQNTKEEY